jgi:hydrogenase-4 component E
MITALNALLVVVLLINLFVLGSSRISALIQAVAVQGVVLGVMPLLAHGHLSLMPALLAIATILAKGSLIPQMLGKALRDAHIKREIEPISALCQHAPGALGTAAAPAGRWHHWLRVTPDSDRPGALPQHSQASCLPGSSVTQAIYLALENGIFISGRLLNEACRCCRTGSAADLFVGVFVISIIIHHQPRVCLTHTRRCQRNELCRLLIILPLLAAALAAIIRSGRRASTRRRWGGSSGP